MPAPMMKKKVIAIPELSSAEYHFSIGDHEFSVEYDPGEEQITVSSDTLECVTETEEPEDESDEDEE